VGRRPRTAVEMSAVARCEGAQDLTTEDAEDSPNSEF
jgi:hypothetical protein